jgi:type IV secretory pathway VirB4 component
MKELEKQIAILENDIKILKAKRKYKGETVKSKLREVSKPTFKISQNPIKLISNFIKYRKQMKEFNKEVKKYITIEKKNRKSEDKKYKMDAIKEFDRHLKIGDKFVRIYYLADLPNFLMTSTLFKLINIPIPLTLSYHIKGTSKGAMLKAARQRLSVLESLQNERLKKGKSRDQEAEKEMEEVQLFIDDLVRDIERVFLVGVYALIQADTKKQLLEYDRKFQDECSDIEFTFNTYSFEQQPALESTLPLCKDVVKEDHLLQTSAVANLLPFLTRNLNDPTGIFFGVNHYNKSILLIDLFKARNANMNIFGTSGSGKSVTSKLMLTRLAMRGVQSIILDPEGEYGELTESLGGEVIKFSRDNGINPFFIGSASPNSIKDHVSVLKHFFKFFIQKDRYDTAKLDKLLMETYESDNPIFKTFLDITRKCAKKDKSIKFVEDLEQLQSGSLSGIFNSEKPIKLNADILCFDLSDLKTDEKKIPAMYLLGTIINRLIDDGTERRRMIFIDESHKLLVNTETTVFYVDLVKTARKRKAGVVSITQNPEDFNEQNNAKTILTQAETSILLKQAPASINHIRNNNIFQLTDRELADLPTFGIGEALFVREKEHIYMDVIPFPKEQELVFTS